MKKGKFDRESSVVMCQYVVCLICVLCSLLRLPVVYGYFAQRCLKRVSTSRSALGEYSIAVIAASNSVERRFFFPNHGGVGPLRRLLKHGNIEQLDLPELDETDNIHSPEVSSTDL